MKSVIYQSINASVSQFSEAFNKTKLSAKEYKEEEEELMLMNTVRPELREIQFYPESWFSLGLCLWFCFLAINFLLDN